LKRKKIPKKLFNAALKTSRRMGLALQWEPCGYDKDGMPHGMKAETKK
jgi:hypothetical protein